MFISEDLYQKILELLPIVCVDVLIVHDGKCLVLLRDNEPAKNTYWFPGGRILKNESIKDAAVRKAKDETNLDCKFIKIISTEESMFDKRYGMSYDVHTVNVCCLMEVSDISSLKIDDFHVAYKWVDKLNKDYHSAVNNPLSIMGYL